MNTLTIPPAISRSWLLVNGARPELYAPATASPADQLILDVEDAVEPKNKTAAREQVADFISAGNSTWVRINDRTSPHWHGDVDRLKHVPGLRGVMLAKTECAEHVTETHDRLGGAVPVIALIESAIGIEESPSIARARGVCRLAFGSGDYRRDTGTSADDMAMAYPRSRLVISSRLGNLPGPIDGPTVTESHATLRKQSTLAVALGMTGKLCLRVEHLAVVNESISPTKADVEWALEFLDDFEASGREIRDGSDLPRFGRAEKIRSLAAAFGINA